MSEIMTANFRDINTITAEIKLIKSNVQKVALEGAIEIGRRLVEAKEMLPHGEWGGWLKDEFEYSQPTASRFMTLFKEYGKEQGSLFGAETKYSTLNTLEISKALLLVAIPEDERESFAEENKIEDMSTRELEKLIREKTAAEKAVKEAQREQKKLSEALAAAKEEAEGARRDLQELRDNPEIPEEVMEKLRAQFGQAAKEAEERAAALEKQLSLAAPELTEFQIHMQSAQRELAAMEDVIGRVSDELGAKLRRAARAVAQQMIERLAG